MLDKTCKLFQDGECPIEYDKCTSGTVCKYYKRDEDFADCGCNNEDVVKNYCDACEAQTITCNCNPYGTCMCC